MVPSPFGQAAVRQRFGTIQTYFNDNTDYRKCNGMIFAIKWGKMRQNTIKHHKTLQKIVKSDKMSKISY